MHPIWQHQAVEFPVKYGVLNDCKFSSQDLAVACDAYSKEGWELVSTFSMSSSFHDGTTSKIIAVFRRRTASPPPLPDGVHDVYKVDSKS